MKRLIINNKKTEDFYSDDVSEASIKNRVIREYGDVKYKLKKVETIKVSKYNFYPLLHGKSVDLPLPDVPTIRNGREVEITNARESAYRFAKYKGIKVTVSKNKINNTLIVKLRNDENTLEKNNR